jgi:hypothetical protein
MKIHTLAIARIAASLITGVIFGLGLAISGMLDPARVRGFLDVAGKFDPSLGFVFAGALSVSALGYWLSRKFSRPAFESAFHLPPRGRIDAKLVAGSALFGLGWGMSGLCPGPAIASLSIGLAPTFLFASTMIFGIALYDQLTRPEAKPADAKESLDAQV